MRYFPDIPLLIDVHYSFSTINQRISIRPNLIRLCARAVPLRSMNRVQKMAPLCFAC